MKFATVPIDDWPMITLNESDLQGALALSVEANWNQTLDDWKMMLAAGTAIGVTKSKNHLVASALTLPYGNTFGWISMVLVTRSWRKKGLATKLLERAIELLEHNGLTPVLDATPAGEPVYRPLGFEPHFAIHRWEIDDAAAIKMDTISRLASQPPGDTEMDIIKVLDRHIFGGDRGTVLDALLLRSGDHARIANQNRGYVLGRNGRISRQIGPLCADDPETAIALLRDALHGQTGAVIIDACDHQLLFVEHLKALGFKKQRPFLRMAKGRQAPFGDPARMFALAGPELG